MVSIEINLTRWLDPRDLVGGHFLTRLKDQGFTGGSSARVRKLKQDYDSLGPRLLQTLVRHDSWC